MRNLMILFLVMTALVLAVGCGKGGPEGEGGEGGEQAAEKVDLSSAKSAFEGFAGRIHKISAKVEKEMKPLFSTPGYEMIKPAITAEYYDFLKKRAEKYGGPREDFDKDGLITFEKEEKGEGGATIIYATQKNTRTERKRDPETKKRVAKAVERTHRHKVVLVQENNEWRVKEWYRQCRSCEGGGKCPQCEGTGKTIARPCPACEGSGKMDGNKCYQCQGSGKTKVRDCDACKKTEGKCPACKGEGWRLETKFADDDMFLEGGPEWKAFSDFSSPLNGAKSFVSLRESGEAKLLKFMTDLAAMSKKMVDDFMVKAMQDKLAEALKKGAEKAKKRVEGRKIAYGEPQVDGDKAVVLVTKTETDHRGKARDQKTALKLVKKDGAWKVDDRGDGCFMCKGTGQCKQCNGTGKTKHGECYSCKKDPGKCSSCKGGKYRWEREQAN